MSFLRALRTLGLALALLAIGFASLFLGRISSVQALAPKSLELVSSLGGSITSLAISGTVAIAGQGYTLASFDVSNPNHIVLLSHVPLPDLAEKVEISATNAYVADRKGGLQIVDIADPQHLHLRGSYETSGEVSDVSVSANRAYVGVHGLSDTALQIIDVTNPVVPANIGSFSLGYGGPQAAIDVSGATAFLGDSKSLTVINVSDPVHPAKLAAVSLAYGAWQIQINGDLVVTVGKAGGNSSTFDLNVVDAQNPASPVLVGHYSENLSPWYGSFRPTLGLVENLAYVSPMGSGLDVFDLTTPASPAIKSNSHFPARDIEVIGSRGFLAGLSGELMVVDFDTSQSPSLAGQYELFASLSDVQVKSPYAFTTDAAEILRVFDVSIPQDPQILPVGPFPGFGSDLAVGGNVAYVNGVNYGVDIFDVTTPASSTLSATYNPASHGSYTAITAAGDYAYIGELGSGVNILDMSNPASPVYKSTAGPISGSGPQSMKRVGNILYIASGNGGLITVDVSNPAYPIIRARVGAGEIWAGGLDVAQEFAFVTAVNDGVYVFDVSNPLSPTIVGKYSTGSIPLGRVRAVGDNLVVVAPTIGLLVLNVSNPSNPRLYDEFPIPCTVRGFDIVDDYIYLACGSGGLRIIRLPGLGTLAESKSFLPLISK